MTSTSERRHLTSTASAAAAVEGLIITAATLTVVAEKRWDQPWQTALQVFATVVVFWLAHMFAHGTAERASTAGPVAGVRHDLRESWPMVAASLPQLAPMLLVGSYGISYDQADSSPSPSRSSASPSGACDCPMSAAVDHVRPLASCWSA